MTELCDLHRSLVSTMAEEGRGQRTRPPLLKEDTIWNVPEGFASLVYLKCSMQNCIVFLLFDCSRLIFFNHKDIVATLISWIISLTNVMHGLHTRYENYQ